MGAQSVVRGAVAQGDIRTLGSFGRNEAIVVNTEAAAEESNVNFNMTCGVNRNIPKTAI